VAITGYQRVRQGMVTTVTVTSDLTGTIFYHWYVDGQHVGGGLSPSRSFGLAAGDELRIEVLDTLDPDFDPVLNAPTGWPARRTLWWVCSLDEDVRQYRIEQKQDSGAWTVIGLVPHEVGTWSHSLLTPRLVDLAEYQWRIVPVDSAGNDGAAITIGPERVVRSPDGPNFTATFDPETSQVTVAAA